MGSNIDRQSIRVYADTSVFGGILDNEFSFASRIFFKQVESGRFVLVVSPVIEDELKDAPDDIQMFYDKIANNVVRVHVSAEARHLQAAYLKARILTARSFADALHVAMATVAQCSLIVSWNFKHVVNFQKIPLYNAINRIAGWSAL